MKLIIFPLLFLVAFSVMSQLGMSELGWGENQTMTGYGGTENGFYDSTDHLVAYANRTAAGEDGEITHPITSSSGPWNDIPIWQNVTGSYNVYTDEGERLLPTQTAITFDMGTSLGLIAVIVGAIILATIAGLRIMGSGTSDVSVSAILKGTVFISIWAVFSILSLGMITAVPMVGPVFYFFITILYTLGIVNNIGGATQE